MDILDTMVDALNAAVPPHQLCLLVPVTGDGGEPKWTKSFNVFASIVAARLNFAYAALGACADAWPSGASLQALGMQFVFFDDVAYSCSQLELIVDSAQLHAASSGATSPLVCHAAVPFQFKCKSRFATGPLKHLILQHSSSLLTGRGVWQALDPLVQQLAAKEAADPARYGGVYSCLKQWVVSPAGLWDDNALLYTQFRVADGFSVSHAVMFGETPFVSARDGFSDRVRGALADAGWPVTGPFRMPVAVGQSMYVCKHACFQRDYVKWFANTTCPIRVLKGDDSRPNLPRVLFVAHALLRHAGQASAKAYLLSREDVHITPTEADTLLAELS